MKVNDAAAVYLGSQAVSKLYLGANQVWPAAPSQVLRMAVANGGGTFHAEYKLVDGTFVRQPDLAVSPGTNARGVAVNGQYMAVGMSGAPYLRIYKRVSGVWQRVTDPAVMPTASTGVPAFTNDGTHLIVPHSNAPYITIYRIDAGDVFTAITFDAGATSGGNEIAYHPSLDIFLACFGGGTTFKAYKKNGATWEAMALPPGASSAIGYGCTFNADGTLAGVAYGNAPSLGVWEFSSAGFGTQLTVPSLTVSARTISILANYVYLGHLTSPFHYLMPLSAGAVGAVATGLIPDLGNYSIGDRKSVV